MRKGMVCVILLVGVTLMFGCATVKKDTTAPATIGDVNRASSAWGKELNSAKEELGKKIDDLAAKVDKFTAKPTEVASPAPKKEEAAAKPAAISTPAKKVVAPAKEELKKVEVNVPEAISDLQKRMEAQEAKTNSLGTDVGLLKKKVAGIKVRVVRVNKAVGTALELSGKEGERYFPIGPFYSGKAKLMPEGEKELKALLLIMKVEGLVAKEIKAFADITRAKSAKSETEGKKMNEVLSAQRGEAIKKGLGELAKDAKIIPRGEADKFGDLAANRQAMVTLAPAPLTPPATPPPPPAASTPAPAK